MNDPESVGLSFIQESLSNMINQSEESEVVVKAEPSAEVLMEDNSPDPIKDQREFESIEEIRQAAIEYGRKHKFAVSTLRSGERQLVLVCKHSGQYRAAKSKSTLIRQEQLEAAAAAAAAAASQSGEEESWTHKKSTRKKASQRIRCPFEIRAKPLGGKWHVYKLHDEHNHDMAEDIRVYAQHRKLDEVTRQLVLDLIDGGSTNAKILEELSMKGIETVLPKDISNLRQYRFKKLKDAESKNERQQNLYQAFSQEENPQTP